MNGITIMFYLFAMLGILGMLCFLLELFGEYARLNVLPDKPKE